MKANKDYLRGLAMLLGHVSLNTVMIYTEPDMEDLAEIMEMAEIGGGAVVDISMDKSISTNESI